MNPDSLKKLVWRANLSLKENGLVQGTQGNVSGIDRRNRIVCIKPSGVAYESLTPETMVEVDLEGRPVKGNLKPSVDTVHHLFLYLNAAAGGVCHTHSPFVTAFAVLKKPVPVLSTGHADVFGQSIPVAPYADNSGDAIGRSLLRTYEKTGCPALILAQHGLFTLGETAEKAAFHAVMAEYCAQTAYYALVLGGVLDRKPASMSRREITKWFDRYHSERYGQKSISSKNC